VTRISAEFQGATVEIDMDRWMFQQQRKLTKLTGWTREEWGLAFQRQEPAAVAFFILLALGDDAPKVTTEAEFTAWWDNDSFDFDLGSVAVVADDEPDDDGEDDSHLPTTSAGEQ